MKVSEMSTPEIIAYLTAPATAAQRHAALAVHSVATIQEERHIEAQDAVLASQGKLPSTMSPAYGCSCVGLGADL